MEINHYIMYKEKINYILKNAKKDKKVIAVALFGSSLKGKGRDIDLCFFLDKKYPNIQMSKTKLKFLKEINDSDKIDIKIFQQLPIYIRSKILKEGKILFCKDEETLYDIAFKTIKEFNSYKKLYDMYLQEVENG